MQSDGLQNWIEAQMMCGRYIFTKEDVTGLGAHNNKDSLKKALYRAQEKGIIMSPWQNFYVAIPMEYRLKGEVLPSFYIDHLMQFVGRDYYVSLLSAAMLNGAGHQRAMVFQVTVQGKQVRSEVKNGTLLDFNLRKEIPLVYINKVKVQTGYMNVSSPELTALDLVSQEEKVGGLSRVAEVLIDLKTNKLSYQDVGQMDMYVKMYDDLVRPEGHNPTIGILLCADTDNDVAHYSTLSTNDQLYAAKYLTYMPTQEELRREIEQQKAFFRLQKGK